MNYHFYIESSVHRSIVKFYFVNIIHCHNNRGKKPDSLQYDVVIVNEARKVFTLITKNYYIVMTKFVNV